LERLRFLAGLVALALAGCTPSIGDKCQLSTDCSLNGTVLCDTSQPNGYCTVFNCAGNDCQPSSTCVLFAPEIPGCPYDDRARARTGRSFCMAPCGSNSDCRTGDGYICADPRQPPWNAIILDNIQSQKVCIQPTSGTVLASMPDASAEPPVCQVSGPDASFVLPGSDAAAPVEAGAEAGTDAGARDAGVDAADGGTDAASDAGIADAADGGG
jgi:hypothetical protein